MSSKREAVLTALHAALIGGVQSAPGRMVLRSVVLPERIPANGLLILRDGTPGEPEVTMSPLTYHYQHEAELELFLAGDGPVTIPAFDTMAGLVGTTLAANRTLGGLCDWAEPSAPEPTDLPVDGGVPIRAAVITITLHYSTPDPLN